MKKLLIFMLLFSVLKANDRKYSIGYFVNTTHITVFDKNSNDYKFYEENNVITIESELNKELIGLVTFKNSFGNDTIGFYGGKKIDKNNKKLYLVYRAGILKGYNQIDYLKSISDPEFHWYGFRNRSVFYKDYSIFGEIGAGYQFSSNFAIELNIISNAVVTSVKYTF